MARRSGRQRKVRSAPMSERVEALALGARPVGEGPAEVEVGGLGEVAVAAQPSDEGRRPAARRRAEQVLHLARDRPPPSPPGRGGSWGTAGTTRGRRRRCPPRSPPGSGSRAAARSRACTWLCIWLTLPKEARIFPTFSRKSPGSDVKVMKPSSTPDLLGAEGQEEVGPRVGVHDGLEGGLHLVHLQRGRGPVAVVAADGAQEVADHRDVGVEDLRGRRPVDGQRPRGTAGPTRSRRDLRRRRRRRLGLRGR